MVMLSFNIDFHQCWHLVVIQLGLAGTILTHNSGYSLCTPSLYYHLAGVNDCREQIEDNDT